MRQAPHRGSARIALLALCAFACLLALPTSAQASEAIEAGRVGTKLISNPELELICWIEPWYCIEETVTVNVKKDGSGSGTVTSSPAGINCGLDCSGQFPEGSTVTLTAKADEGSKFTGWSGGSTGVSEGCSGTGACKITLAFIRLAVFPPPPLPPVSVAATFDLESPSLGLAVSKTGGGSGTVTSSPAGISCGGACSAEFEEGATVKLIAEAEAGSDFREWTGACSGASTSCEVTMDEAKSVSARFSHERPRLTLGKSGAGVVKSKLKGIVCLGSCTSAVGQYVKGTTVVLSAKAMIGGALEGWEGCDSSTNTGLEGTCTVAMSEARNVKATFKAPPKPLVNPQVLALAKAGTGTGSVKGTGLVCEAACVSTQVEYFGGVTVPKPIAATTVTLVAMPSAGSEFAGWEGCESEPEGKCVVLMSKLQSVTARFDAKPKLALTVNKTGYGAVRSKPKGISCGNTCLSAVSAQPEGAVVVLSAKAPLTSGFSGWEGCKVLTQTELESTCEVTMSSAKAVKATFKAPAKPIVNPQTLTLTKAGTGTGTVKATGLICEAACTTTQVLYYGGVTAPKPKAAATVTLVAIPTLGSDPVEWEGCESEPEGKCVVLMSKVQSVTARFEE